MCNNTTHPAHDDVDGHAFRRAFTLDITVPPRPLTIAGVPTTAIDVQVAHRCRDRPTG